MKKTIAMLLLLILCLNLCACKKDVKAEIILNGGDSLQLTSKEVFEDFGKYHNAGIRITAKVVNIECIPINTLYSGWVNHYQITLEGGWVIYRLSENAILPLCIDVDDTISVEGCMYRREGSQVMILAFTINGHDVA